MAAITSEQRRLTGQVLWWLPERPLARVDVPGDWLLLYARFTLVVLFGLPYYTTCHPLYISSNPAVNLQHAHVRRCSREPRTDVIVDDIRTTSAAHPHHPHVTPKRYDTS